MLARRFGQRRSVMTTADGSFLVRFVLAVLATWRVTHLLASEDGPADIVARFRARLGDGVVGTLLDCFFCLSVWVAGPMTVLARPRPADRVVTWLAMSGAACLLERTTREAAGVTIQPLTELERGQDDGLLWSEKGGAESFPTPVPGDADTPTGDG